MANNFKITEAAQRTLLGWGIHLSDNNLRKYLVGPMTVSIKVYFGSLSDCNNQDFFGTLRKLTMQFRLPEFIKGHSEPRGTMSWEDRARKWHVNPNNVLVLGTRGTELLVMTHDELHSTPDTAYAFPIFLTMFTSQQAEENYLTEYNINTQETQEMPNKTIAVPAAFSSLIEQNKDAMQLAAKLSVGKTANSLLLDAVTSKLPWYAKMFGKSDAVRANPLTKLATAQLANLLAQHFAQGNEKISYVADAMLQEAMVDLVTNADVVNDLIEKLGSFAGNLTDVPKVK
jgi:hypothetical protein